MRLLATLAALAFLMPSVAAAAHPVAVRQAEWLAEAEATRARVVAAHEDLPNEFENAWSRLDATKGTLDVDIAVSYALFLSVVDFVEARANVTIDRRTDGGAGCTGNSSCARFLAGADAAAAQASEALNASRERARGAWSDLDRARGLETAVVAEVAFGEARSMIATYPEARARLTGLRTYDPDSVAYERLLMTAWIAAHHPLHLASLVDALVDDARASDVSGPLLDRGLLAEYVAALAQGVASRLEANATTPEVGAAFVRFVREHEYDRLIFNVGGGGQDNEKLRQVVESRVENATALLAAAQAVGLEGTFLEAAVDDARRELGSPLASDARRATAGAHLLAAMELYPRLLGPAVLVEAAPPHEEGGNGAVVAALVTTGALALVGAAALLLRRKP